MGARLGGKIKTIAYVVAGSLALLATCILRIGMDGNIYLWVALAAKLVFTVSVIIAIISFIDYVSVYIKTSQKN